MPINYARGLIGDQATKTLAQLQPAPETKENTKPAPSLVDPADDNEQIDGQLSGAARGKLGRTSLEPMFTRPDEALKLFNRLVEGLGLVTTREVGELTRTAAVVKTKDTDEIEEYTIKYLSSFSGLAMSFSKPERLLTSVELLVTWSVTDLENYYDKKYKKRTVGKEKILDYGKLQSGHQLIAVLDGNGNVRSVRFTKAK